ncbi:hypothetical protein Sjap_016072 [Stephania japonica]|uniref:Uncharacterized protein n=1 Tax=Stephania japonica TaxID=461633 RepID=A0AAP0IKU3_9MAGN
MTGDVEDQANSMLVSHDSRNGPKQQRYCLFMPFIHCMCVVFLSPETTVMAVLSSTQGHRGIVGDLTMSVMESHNPGASLLAAVNLVSVISCNVVVARLIANHHVWSALPPNTMTKGASRITPKPLCVSHNSQSVHIDGEELL